MHYSPWEPNGNELQASYSTHFIAGERSLQYAPDRELAGTQQQSGSGKEKNFCPAESQILRLVFWSIT
jgi:hypothetical protein